MKMTCTKACVYPSCALVCLLLMGICSGGASCSDLDIRAGLGYAIGQECGGNTSVSRETVLSSRCPDTERSGQECCRSFPDSSFRFGCYGGLVLPNQTKSMTLTTFTWIRVVTNDAVLANNGLPAQSPGTANAALPFLRTVVLLT